MKKYLLILFFLTLTINILKSQKYNFTTRCTIVETQVKGNYKNQSRQIKVMYNLKDSDYISYLYPKENLLLYDYKNNVKLIFDINYYNNYNKLQLLLKSIINTDKDDKDDKEIQLVTTEDLGNNKYFVRAFSNKNGKNVNLELVFELEKSEYPLVKFDFLDLSKSIHDKIYESLICKLPNANYQLKNVYYDYKNGVVMYEDFSNCKEVNLTFDF